jgi:anti-sigma B factor antagonist
VSDPGIAFELRGTVGLVSISGEIDLSVADQVEQVISDAGDAPVVVVDLTGVTFIDSSGLRALVSGRDSLESKRRSMALVVGDSPVARLLSLTALDKEFAIHPSVDSALASD